MAFPPISPDPESSALLARLREHRALLDAWDTQSMVVLAERWRDLEIAVEARVSLLAQEVAELELINKGGIAEQVVGQLLRTIRPFYQDPSLYYWMRPEKKASAEVDYVIQHKGAIVPVEVKAGSTGRLKSLHLFMGLKKLPLAVRINGEPPLKSKIHTKDHQGQSIKYELTSIPFYLIGELPRLMG